jgi:hypothetical protein
MAAPIGYSGANAAARALGIAPAKVREAMRSGALISHRCGCRGVILASDLESWIRGLPARTYRSTPSEECHVG